MSGDHWFCVIVRLFLRYSLVADLQGGGFAPGAVQLVQLAESALGPDAEAADVTTGGEPQEVQFVHVLQGDAFKNTTTCQTGGREAPSATASTLHSALRKT